MNNKKKNITSITNNISKHNSENFDNEVIEKIKEIQSLPVEIVVEFLKSQGSLKRLLDENKKKKRISG